jgi:hypothetical protein
MHITVVGTVEQDPTHGTGVRIVIGKGTSARAILVPVSDEILQRQQAEVVLDPFLAGDPSVKSERKPGERHYLYRNRLVSVQDDMSCPDQELISRLFPCANDAGARRAILDGRSCRWARGPAANVEPLRLCGRQSPRLQ